MTVDDVAARAGVSNATIYRWWNSKAELALDAFVGDVRARVPVADTGTLEGDLRVRMRATVRTHAAALRERVVRPLRDGSREVFRRAIARGEIGADEPVDLALDIVVGAVYYRLLLGTAPVDNLRADAAVHLIVGGAHGA